MNARGIGAKDKVARRFIGVLLGAAAAVTAAFLPIVAPATGGLWLHVVALLLALGAVAIMLVATVPFDQACDACGRRARGGLRYCPSCFVSAWEAIAAEGHDIANEASRAGFVGTANVIRIGVSRVQWGEAGVPEVVGELLKRAEGARLEGCELKATFLERASAAMRRACRDAGSPMPHMGVAS